MMPRRVRVLGALPSGQRMRREAKYALQLRACIHSQGGRLSYCCQQSGAGGDTLKTAMTPPDYGLILGVSAQVGHWFTLYNVISTPFTPGFLSKNLARLRHVTQLLSQIPLLTRFEPASWSGRLRHKVVGRGRPRCGQANAEHGAPPVVDACQHGVDVLPHLRTAAFSCCARFLHSGQGSCS